MKTKPGLESFRLALFVGLGAVSCSNQGDLDSESHFACRADPDCEMGDRCVANVCEASPGVPGHGRIEDAVDPRAATTPNCATEPCTGGLQGLYTARPPDGLQWRWGGLPLFAVAPNGTIILSFEESDVSGANLIPVIRRLTPELEEISTTRLSSREGLNGALYVDDGGFARVDSIYAEGQPGTLKIQTFDTEMQPRAHRDVQLPLGTSAQRVSSSGDIMLRGHSSSSTLNATPEAAPLEGCPEIDSLFKMSADGELTPLLCFRGLSIVMFDESPSGFAAYGTVKGPPSETRSIDFGEGPIDAAGGATILVRYDRNLRVVWTSTVLPASDPFLNPASGGALWATGFAGHFAFPLPPDFSPTRREAVYLDSHGQRLFADAEDGWTPGGVLVDGAGNGVLVRDKNPTEAQAMIQFGEIRKIATDGSVAWTVQVEYGWGGASIAAGPNGDVYVGAIIKDDRTIYPAATEKIDDMTFEGPILAVLRYAP